MISALLMLNALAAAYIFIRYLNRRAPYTHFPFLASAVYIGWYLPQCIQIANEFERNPNNFLSLLALSFSSLVAIEMGWRLPRSQLVSTQYSPTQQQTKTKKKRQNSRLRYYAVATTLVAVAMQVLIAGQSADVRLSSQWSGSITILAFFASISSISLATSITLYLRDRRRTHGILVAINLALYGYLSFILWRRADMIELVLIPIVILYFVRRVQVPKLAFLAAMLVGALTVSSIGQIRSLSSSYNIESDSTVLSLRELSQVDWFAAFDSDNPQFSEARNATQYLEALKREDLLYGGQLWNQFVQSYVPGQIIGPENKQALIVGGTIDEVAFREHRKSQPLGLTSTGFVDPFRDFGYLGVLVFFAASALLRMVHNRAESGDLHAMVLYAATLNLALHSITHFGYYLFVKGLLPFIFLIPLYLVLQHRNSVPPAFVARRLAR